MPISFPSLKILGGRVDRVSLEESLLFIEQNIAQDKFIQVITVNALMLRETQRDGVLREVFERAGLVVCDSVGVSLVGNLKKFSLPCRIPGIDLLLLLCKKAQEKSWPVYLVGAKPGIAERAKENLREKFPQLKISGSAHGYFDAEEEKRILLDISSQKPRIVFVGLNIPFQEKWIDRNRANFQGMCVMGVGGSFDVLSGNLIRAPTWIQTCGLEWLFRLIQEPWRWKRVFTIPPVLIKAAFAPSVISIPPRSD